MRRTIALLMFPYFAPLVGLSVLAFAYMLATPPKPGDGMGPAGSDVLGLYFFGVCIIVGGGLQLVIGLPLNALISRVSRFAGRLLISVVSVLIPTLLYIPVMLESSSEPFEDALGMGIVIVTFGLGAWFVSSTLKQTKPNKAHHPPD